MGRLIRAHGVEDPAATARDGKSGRDQSQHLHVERFTIGRRCYRELVLSLAIGSVLFCSVDDNLLQIQKTRGHSAPKPFHFRLNHCNLAFHSAHFPAYFVEFARVFLEFVRVCMFCRFEPLQGFELVFALLDSSIKGRDRD